MLKYIDDFLTLRCTPDLLAARVFPRRPAKEVTEVMGAWSAVRKALPRLDILGDPRVVLVDVGCGVKPRGAALAACMSVWSTIGVDPRLKSAGAVPGIHRCEGIKGTIQDFLTSEAGKTRLVPASLVIFMNTHGHADLSYLREIETEAPCICCTIPCCFPLTPPDDFVLVSHEKDPWILSPQNEVFVWSRFLEMYDGSHKTKQQ